MKITVRDICSSTYLFEQDKAKPRYELKLRPATGADKTRFPRHLIGENKAGNKIVCTRIRAIQGHSAKVNVATLERNHIKFEDPDFPSILGHATDHEKLQSIMDIGLQPGGLDRRRDENHFLPIRPERARTALVRE